MERKGGHHLGRRISKHTTASDRGNEPRAGRKRKREREREEKYTREKGMHKKNLKEVGTRKEERRLRRRGKRTRGRVRLRRGGAQLGTGKRKSRVP